MGSVSVFEAFPSAVIKDVWEIGSSQRGTIVGTEFAPLNYMDVIIDEGSLTSLNYAPNAAELEADCLVYAKPEQLPTIRPSELVAYYLVHNTEDDDYYAITQASLGRNQNTGEVEHVELLLQRTEVVDE